ncbi:MAG: hypothetical protein U9R16_00785 [Campylobacterota bacterium]|nr:hypothetical protein [Campylobacterota bacterium]
MTKNKTKSFLVPIVSLVIVSIITIALINTYLNILLIKDLKMEANCECVEQLSEVISLLINKIDNLNHILISEDILIQK